MLKIDYESEGFPSGSIPNGSGVLDTTWGEVLWAAVTVGRPNRNYVFRHGDASQYEAIFRWSLVRMALEQGGVRAFRLRRTDAAKTLDPTEKGAVNYFLGLIFCKLFAAKLLDAPWALHLDVFGRQVRAISGRSRPDLIAETSTGEWVSLEAKGRVSPPSQEAKSKAKDQATRIASINSKIPKWHIGGISYFNGDALNFFWRDPVPDSQQRERGVNISLYPDTWRHYYAPVFELLMYQDSDGKAGLPAFYLPKNADIEVAVHPEIMKCLLRREWGMAKEVASKLQSVLRDCGYMPDGIKIVPGNSWLKPLEQDEI